MEESPIYTPLGGPALVVASRGLEVSTGRWVVSEEGWKPRLDLLPGLGSEWGCEYYIDTGSRGARSPRGVEEGFVIKTSVYARCLRDGGLTERLLYPLGSKTPNFLALQGDERKRQAATYIAEIAAALALASGEASLPPGLAPGGKTLVVRHGALLQQLTGYLNEVFNLEERMALAILTYSGLPKHHARDLVDIATVESSTQYRVNSGILAAAIIGEIKRVVASGEASVIGLSEDVSRGRHLAITSLAILGVEGVKVDYTLTSLVMRGLEEAESGGAPRCWEDLDPRAKGGVGPQMLAGEYSFVLLRALMEGVAGERLDSPGQGGFEAMKRAADKLSSMGLGDVIRVIHEKQVLNRVLLVPNDNYYIMAYLYLYGPDDLPLASPRHSKSAMVKPHMEKNIREKGLEEKLESGAGVEAPGWVDGVEFRYILPDRVPPCRQLSRMASKIGVDRRLLAELVKVKPPLRVEYFSVDASRDVVDAKVYAASEITQYGVPPQLLVVDSKSRVNEWDVGALRQLLEAHSKRLLPYSTFIRDFATRMAYV